MSYRRSKDGGRFHEAHAIPHDPFDPAAGWFAECLACSWRSDAHLTFTRAQEAVERHGACRSCR